MMADAFKRRGDASTKYILMLAVNHENTTGISRVIAASPLSRITMESGKSETSKRT
jgi:hypothetical protein